MLERMREVFLHKGQLANSPDLGILSRKSNLVSKLVRQKLKSLTLQYEKGHRKYGSNYNEKQKDLLASEPS